jgi:non-heme chloroperoxidase
MELKALAGAYAHGVALAHVNGVRLYYEERGAGAPIACIHGGGSSAVMWGEAVQELARLSRVICL